MSSARRRAAEYLRRAAEREGAERAGRVDPHSFAGRPVDYARQVLGVTTLTDEQLSILGALHAPPYRVLVPSAHNVGKTFIAAVAACYWYDSFNPGLVLTTAPTERDVRDLLWTEIRLLRQRAAGLHGLSLADMAPSDAFMGDAPDHYAQGFVSQKNRPFQGRHRRRMLFIFDEANEVQPLHWITTRTMHDPDPAAGHSWLVIFNPTTTTSQAYQESMLEANADGGRYWNQMRLSALTHPNVLAELEGRPKPIPGAISLAMVNDNLSQWTERVERLEDVEATDVEWPPGGGRYYRPGPLFQARVMGIWPDTGSGVWSPAVWEACFPLREPALPPDRVPEIGVDCAQGKGEDYHAIHCRWGAVSLHHETANTMKPVRIAHRIRECCAMMAAEVDGRAQRGKARCDPKRVVVRIEDDGTGNAIGDFLKQEGYTVQLVSVARRSTNPDRYPRMRDQAWFNGAEKAKAGLVCLNRLDKKTLARLRQQLLAVTWEPNAAGQREVEQKDKTKERIGRSPDDADAFNLAYLDVAGLCQGEAVPNETRQPRTDFGDADLLKVTGRQRMYGRGE